MTDKQTHMLQIIHHPTCSKCIGLLEYLQNSKIPYEHRDYLQHPLNYAELEAVLTQLGLAPIEIIRQTEPRFQERYGDMDSMEQQDQDWIQAIVDYPELLQRPIIIKDNQAIIGRPLEKAFAFVTEKRII